MKIKKGKGTSEYGKGVNIVLSGDELALAINSWLHAKGVYTSGPVTTRVNDGEQCFGATVYVDPSGSVIKNGTRYLGRTGKKEKRSKE